MHPFARPLVPPGAQHLGEPAPATICRNPTEDGAVKLGYFLLGGLVGGVAVGVLSAVLVSSQQSEISAQRRKVRERERTIDALRGPDWRP